MEQLPPCHRAVVFALGGPTILAKELGIYRPAPPTLHWTRRGIPSRYWHRVADLLSAKLECHVTAADIERIPIRLADSAP